MAQPPKDNPEFGRELLASELKEKTVVWITREDRNTFATIWVAEIDAAMVIFYAGETGINLITFRRGEELHDDTGVRIRVYEYLGAI